MKLAFDTKNLKKWIIPVIFSVVLFCNNVFPVTYYSNGSGNFDDTNIWNDQSNGFGNAYTADANEIGNDFVIQNGDVIIANITATMDALQIDSGGELRFTGNGGTAVTFNVTGNVTVNNSGLIGTSSDGSYSYHTLKIGGDLSETGNFQWSNSDDGITHVIVIFDGSSRNQDFSMPVELTVFDVKPEFNKILIEWKTASESENLGFNLYRKLAREDVWNKINEELIAGQGNTSAETNYEFADKFVQAGEIYSYKLESVSYNGVVAIEKIVDIALPVPAEYVLYNNYPNPFNPLTHIKFQLPEFSNVTISIYDITGKLVKTVIKDVNYEAGSYIADWDATNQYGTKVSSGIYFYRFSAGTFSKLGRMVLLK